MKKAQSSIVMILLVIVVFGGLAVFLLSLAGNVQQEDYMNIYTHNTLLSMLRTDTGDGGDCKLVSDALTCGAYGLLCDSGTPCRTFAEDRVDYYMDALSYVKATYDWYLAVYDNNDITLLELGNTDLVSEKTKKWSASQTVYKRFGSSDQTFIVRLILARS